MLHYDFMALKVQEFARAQVGSATGRQPTHFQEDQKTGAGFSLTSFGSPVSAEARM